MEHHCSAQERFVGCQEKPFFIIEESFLKSSDGKLVIRHLGRAESIMISREIEEIGSACFFANHFLKMIEFIIALEASIYVGLHIVFVSLAYMHIRCKIFSPAKPKTPKTP
jgi:hypothetical protein